MALELKIKEKLENCFSITTLDVENESDKHAGHAGSPGTGESHFRVHIVSPDFEGKSRIEMHRAVHDCLKEEIAGGIHALAITAFPK